MSKLRLLIVEDDDLLRDTLALEFQDYGFHVQALASVDQYMKLDCSDFDAAIIDLKLGIDNGLKIVDALAKSQPNCRIVVLTGYGSIATAVQATKLGANNYLTKPVSTPMILEAISQSPVSPEFGPVAAETFTLARAEREYIESVIAACSGNISKAAMRLGLHRQSLQRKLRKYSPRV